MILTHSIILSPVSAEELLHPRIGYHNLFREGTVTVSSEHADHPAELAFDGLTYDGWQPTSGGEQWIAVELDGAESADYMAVLGSLAGCSLTPQYTLDGSTWIDLATTFQPADNKAVIWEFESVSAAE